MDLKGKSILITGGGVRVGRSMAKAVAQAGATVIVHYGSSAAEAASLKGELEAAGATAHLLQADFSQAQQAASLIERAL